jgi:hypothetical protein
MRMWSYHSVLVWKCHRHCSETIIIASWKWTIKNLRCLRKRQGKLIESLNSRHEVVLDSKSVILKPTDKNLLVFRDNSFDARPKAGRIKSINYPVVKIETDHTARGQFGFNRLKDVSVLTVIPACRSATHCDAFKYNSIFLSQQIGYLAFCQRVMHYFGKRGWTHVSAQGFGFRDSARRARHFSTRSLIFFSTPCSVGS